MRDSRRCAEAREWPELLDASLGLLCAAVFGALDAAAAFLALGTAFPLAGRPEAVEDGVPFFALATTGRVAEGACADAGRLFEAAASGSPSALARRRIDRPKATSARLGAAREAGCARPAAPVAEPPGRGRERLALSRAGRAAALALAVLAAGALAGRLALLVGRCAPPTADGFVDGRLASAAAAGARVLPVAAFARVAVLRLTRDVDVAAGRRVACDVSEEGPASLVFFCFFTFLTFFVVVALTV